MYLIYSSRYKSLLGECHSFIFSIYACQSFIRYTLQNANKLTIQIERLSIEALCSIVSGHKIKLSNFNANEMWVSTTQDILITFTRNVFIDCWRCVSLSLFVFSVRHIIMDCARIWHILQWNWVLARVSLSLSLSLTHTRMFEHVCVQSISINKTHSYTDTNCAQI